jgi:NAD(P)H-dependent FMN reductase
MTKLLFLSGSSRKDSLNKKLTNNAVAIAKKIGSANITHIDLADFPMPIYNGDIEDESGLPEHAKRLKKLFIEHDGFFIASPEYNSSISPLLKNSLDWISRKETSDESGLIAFTGKVAAISAASIGGLGGIRGLVHLRMMLTNIFTVVVPQQLTIPTAQNEFDADGNLSEKYQKSLHNVVAEFITTATKLKK